MYGIPVSGFKVTPGFGGAVDDDPENVALESSDLKRNKITWCPECNKFSNGYLSLSKSWSLDLSPVDLLTG